MLLMPGWLLASSMHLHPADYLHRPDAMLPPMLREHSQLRADSDAKLRAVTRLAPVVQQSLLQYGARHVGYLISAVCDRVAAMG